jgi:predicted SnoaL-like aldol condensation-catalyzing enzyme
MILKKISWALVGLSMLGICGISLGQVPITARPDPTKSGAKYTTTSFDMFRVKDGKAVEHWDIIPKMINPPHPQ